jgi:hypothetical protein
MSRCFTGAASTWLTGVASRQCSNYMKIMALTKLMIFMVMFENLEPHENHEFHNLSLRIARNVKIKKTNDNN